jgi:protein-S-isoprenylcysteine O-methyltransferase
MWDDLWTFVHDHGVVGALAVVLCAAWVGAEAYARRSTWRQGAERKPSGGMDRGTYPIIAIGVAVAVVGATASFLLGLGSYLPLWVSGVGAFVTVVGLAIRVWALTTLGRFFTMPITIRTDHEIVRSGPYRWIRHPAYTGGFLTAFGIPIVLGTPVGILVAIVALLSVYVYRIRIEEGVLVARFGEEYREYSRTTYRMLPPVF